MRTADWDEPEGVVLRLAQRAELDARYGRDDHEPGPKPTAADIDVYLIAVDDESGDAIACGALRRLEDGVAEIKRMYVRPENRGSGVATAVLRALENEAVSHGWRTLRLETGTEQPDAIRFYTREGYHEIDLFGYYVDSDLSVCFERSL
ncbi:GNAT family N-acetyltransferase [Amnibacterium flavum]|uniref:GNAT family N-acetyltransferase n=1 Tax=Amnibacterium flavum TaxID=2173173 RepID=A0A2V1HV29_9MICO|nr:GNAT family N-acetyltransferase [Amnibacterium flavum]